MASSPSSIAAVPRSAKNAMFPSVLFVHGAERREIGLSMMAFTIGRKTGKDLEIPDPRISRDHAEIVCEEGVYFVVDNNSKLGTYVNKERVTKRKLARNDRVEFGVGVGAYVVFDPTTDESSVAREFLSQISVINVQDKASDLEKLALFLNAARKLNTTGALEEIFVSLIETTLKLTGAERGFIFLRQVEGRLQLAAACTSKGDRLMSDETISHSILEEAVKAASEFVVTDTAKDSGLASRQSIIAHDLRTVIAIPLRRAHKQGDEAVIGVLYLDSRFASGSISGVSHDILGVIAREAAALVESTHLAQMEEASRRYQQELSIAAMIQQRLMTVTIPELNFASLCAKNLPCRDIGGDFFDVVATDCGLYVVVTDVSGKGMSAALLASILQGLIYSQLVAGVPLTEIVTSANRYLCQRILGEKYATAVIMHITPTGEVEYVNCGHVPPLVIKAQKATSLESGNLPVGLLTDAAYEAATFRLEPGDRVVIVTDGVTEAEDAAGEFFGDERLEHAAVAVDGPCFDHIFAAVRSYCGEMPLNDDCTVLELVYRGKSKDKSDSSTNLQV
jgi:serine phosphatase RsbU (regulator of sigma subunit)/pSer/pThr/pTyr-binding forkhead associated (FHA) protein